MTDSIHDWDGAYVLGALSPEERRAYEQHLAECDACSRSVRDLAGLPGILGRLDPEEAVALRDLPDGAALQDGAHVPDRAAGIARRVRRSRRRSRVVAALVVVGVLLVGSIGGWSLLRAAQPQQAVAARTLEPVGASGLTASLSVTPVGWGTRLDWSCDYRGAASRRESYAPVSYSLVVHTDAGTTSTVATWTSDAGEAKGLAAATAIPVDAIRSIDIRVTGSKAPLAETRF
jgi:hypothetical protein